MAPEPENQHCLRFRTEVFQVGFFGWPKGLGNRVARSVFRAETNTGHESMLIINIAQKNEWCGLINMTQSWINVRALTKTGWSMTDMFDEHSMAQCFSWCSWSPRTKIDTGKKNVLWGEETAFLYLFDVRSRNSQGFWDSKTHWISRWFSTVKCWVWMSKPFFPDVGWRRSWISGSILRIATWLWIHCRQISLGLVCH